MSSELEVVAVDGTRQLITLERHPHVLRELAVQVVPVAGSIRIEPIQRGALLQIDGEEVLCKQLCAGEFVTIGGVRLRCVRITESPPKSMPAGSSTPTQPQGRVQTVPIGEERQRLTKRAGASSRQPAQKPTRTRQRLQRKSSWAPALAITVAILVVVVFVMQRLRNSTWPHSPQHFVELAQTQYDNNKPERALETVAFALTEATGKDRDEALALEQKIRRRLLDNASVMQVVAAQHEHDLLQSFVASYLQSVDRPAARECVRLCDVWLQSHRDACTAHSQGQPLLDAVEALRERYVVAASLATPETAEDVIFAAHSRLRFQWRDYIGALQRLDEYLLRNAGNEAALAARKSILAEGEEWFQKRMRRLDSTIARGDSGNAEKDLDQLERWVAIPQWQAQIAERRARVPSPR